MKYIVFDSGPLISLTISNMLWLLEPLKRKFKGDFIITPSVKIEVVDRPIKTRRFRFEALQIMEKIEEGTIKLIKNKKIELLGKELTNCVNSLFSTKEKTLHIVDMGEMESLAASIILKSKAVIVDERVTLSLIDDPHRIRNVLEKRLHQRVTFNDEKIHELRARFEDLCVLRSTELVARAYELGLLDRFTPNDVLNPDETLIDALLWKVKLSGAAITEREINTYKRILVHKD